MSSTTDLIDAKLEEHRMIISKQCPSCGHKLDQKPDWVGLPAGVKFDPTDQELIEHLEAKVAEGSTSGSDSNSKLSHPLIDEFIPTIQGEDGICYTHPERLPGVTRDGLSKHFFHRPSKAYTTGTRKRRKIQTECDLQRGETRWHKTGKTRPVMVNGKQKGCKKILVLYTNFGKHRKPEKTNWVMHQYHLGELEEEKEGELVVSKIFYQTQPRQCSWSADKGSAGSCSSKEVLGQREVEVGGGGDYGGIENFSFGPFRKSFDEVGMGEVSTKTRETHEEHGHHEHGHLRATSHHQLSQEQQQNRQAASAAFHNISRPTNPISSIISPTPIHQSSVVLDDAFHVSRILMQQTDKFQPSSEQQQQPAKKLVERSSAGLEELIMGCTSSGNRG
ncbi:uncharacterized protein A4U43_C01F21310, partial [Asparagus officinalis]